MKSGANVRAEEIERKLRSLSLREKIGQTAQVTLESLDFSGKDALADFLGKYPVGSVFGGPDIINTFSSKMERAEAIANCNSRLKVPLAVAGDLENGANFPMQLALAAARDPKLAYEYGRWTAIEGRRKGFTWAFAPVVDIAMNWLNPAVTPRCLGDDPAMIAELSAQVVRGMQDNRLSATAKHFPGDGVDLRDQHLGISVNPLSRSRWMRSFGKIYKKLFAKKTGVDSIMTGHILLPFVDGPSAERPVPLPATLSAKISRDFLRGELGFEGVVVTDALIMNGFLIPNIEGDRYVAAFKAGADVLLWPGLEYFELMEREIESGRLPLETLDDSVRRILAMKEKEGLFLEKDAAEKPVTLAERESLDAAKAAMDEEIAARGAVLLRNEEKLLPLDKSKTKRILVWIAAANAKTDEKSYQPFLDALKARGAETTVRINGNCLDLRKLEDKGERFDAVVFLFNQGMHDAKNAIRPVGEAGECLWTLGNTKFHKPVVVSFKFPYMLMENPLLHALVNMNSGASKTVQETAVKLLYGELPFTGVSPVAAEPALGVDPRR